MIFRRIAPISLAALLVSACGGGGGDPPAPVVARLCPQSLDYDTVFTGASGSGELVQVRLDTAAMTYRLTYLASPVPREKGTIEPTRSSPPGNSVSGTLTQETLLPTPQQNQCAFRLDDASLDASRPARIFVGDGVLGGTIPGAQIAFAGVAGIGVVTDTTFPYYPFIAFSQTTTSLTEIAGTYSMLGYHEVPSQNFARVAVDASFSINADGSFTECDNSGLYAGQCRQSGTNFALRADSPVFETERFSGQVKPTQAVDGPHGEGLLIVGKLRGQLVPVLIRVGAADSSIFAPPGAPPKTPVADDESGIALLAPQRKVAPGSMDGEYIGVDSNFAYRATALAGAQGALLDPFNASLASRASAIDLDFAQTVPGVVKAKNAFGRTGLLPTSKMIFTGSAFAYLDLANPDAPYFMIGALVR
jgi:hypothetical protein